MMTDRTDRRMLLRYANEEYIDLILAVVESAEGNLGVGDARSGSLELDNLWAFETKHLGAVQAHSRRFRQR